MTKLKKDSLKALKENIKKSYDILTYFSEDDLYFDPEINYNCYDGSLEIEFCRPFRIDQKSNTISLTIESDNTMFVDSNEREFTTDEFKNLDYSKMNDRIEVVKLIKEFLKS